MKPDAGSDSLLGANAELLAARTGHQLANLLTPLNGCLELFRNDPTNVAELAESLPLLDQIAQRMAIHIDDLLMCRPRPLAIQKPLSLPNLLDQAVAMVKATGLAEDHDIIVLHDPSNAAPTVSGDGRLLAHLLVNLLVNAAEAMRQPGRIEVEIRRGELGPVVSVRDTGPGIAPQLLECVFEPFQSTKGSNSGMGLGLYVARLIAEQHNARISLSTNRPHGLAVDIEFAASSAA